MLKNIYNIFTEHYEHYILYRGLVNKHYCYSFEYKDEVKEVSKIEEYLIYNNYRIKLYKLRCKLLDYYSKVILTE